MNDAPAAPGYREWRPAAALGRHVACSWAGRMGPGGERYVDRVLPDGCVDVVWDGTDLVVAGPDTRPVTVVGRADGFYVGVRFRPGLAPVVLGLPASELRDLRVAAADVLGAAGSAELADGLASASALSLRAAALVLEDAVVGWLGRSAATEPDPLVEATVDALGRRSMSRGPSVVASLAGSLGVSERQLHRRCRAAVGYGPKTLDRVLRFRRFLALADQRPDAGLARLAIEAGYADQPHLNRECNRLAGTTPAALVAV